MFIYYAHKIQMQLKLKIQIKNKYNKKLHNNLLIL